MIGRLPCKGVISNTLAFKHEDILYWKPFFNVIVNKVFEETDYFYKKVFEETVKNG